jgi:hypothetical protein
MKMPMRITENRLVEFVTALKEAGGSSGNRALRQRLDWDEEFYWKIQGRLIESGKIAPGRGKGGSVHLADVQEERARSGDGEPDIPNESIKECDLYKPLKEAIEKKWINRFGFDDVRVHETYSPRNRARKGGGTFTRPDITAAGIRRYVYLPKRLEIVTFEVKSSESVDIMGVLESIAHREAAHRSYVIYATSREGFDSTPENDRILELSQKYGIGVILAEPPESVEDWEIFVDALRHKPDPARLEAFIGDLPSDGMKNDLAKWKD